MMRWNNAKFMIATSLMFSAILAFAEEDESGLQIAPPIGIVDPNLPIVGGGQLAPTSIALPTPVAPIGVPPVQFVPPGNAGPEPIPPTQTQGNKSHFLL